MEHITTYSGIDFDPLDPVPILIAIEDIAHALSMMCRANGHFSHFYSVAQHSINCAKEAKARGSSDRVQLACLLHDASEAYISDITRPVKKHLNDYKDIENRLQSVIYENFLGSSLTEKESIQVDEIDRNMLLREFHHLMKKRVFNNDSGDIISDLSFGFSWFDEVEREFIDLFNDITTGKSEVKEKLKDRISYIEKYMQNKNAFDVSDFVYNQGIFDSFGRFVTIKHASSQVDVSIHAYGTLLALSNILKDDEVIEELSLGAGNTGKLYDVATSKRLAEFKFALWQDKSNTIRQNTIFKDFVGLVKHNDYKGRKKYIYCLSYESVMKFFTECERSLKSVLSRNTMHQKHEDIWDLTVKEYYETHKNDVEIVDLQKLLCL